jgi:hypothetical protein
MAGQLEYGPDYGGAPDYEIRSAPRCGCGCGQDLHGGDRMSGELALLRVTEFRAVYPDWPEDEP